MLFNDPAYSNSEVWPPAARDTFSVAKPDKAHSHLYFLSGFILGIAELFFSWEIFLCDEIRNKPSDFYFDLCRRDYVTDGDWMIILLAVGIGGAIWAGKWLREIMRKPQRIGVVFTALGLALNILTVLSLMLMAHPVQVILNSPPVQTYMSSRHLHIPFWDHD